MEDKEIFIGKHIYIRIQLKKPFMVRKWKFIRRGSRNWTLHLFPIHIYKDNNYKLIDRVELKEEDNQVKTPCTYFYLYINNKKYSVINLKSLNRNNPYITSKYKWEAWEKGADVDEVKRFYTLNEMVYNLNGRIRI